MKLNVLDKGYVYHKNSWLLGDGEIEVINDARVSFDKQIDVISKDDIRLLSYLIKNGHTSPFRHSVIKFELYAPLMVCRQWWKYVVGSSHTEHDTFLAWNESSRRYITESNEFYLPKSFRHTPLNRKQGSDGYVSQDINDKHIARLIHLQSYCQQLYEDAIQDGIAPEQARLFLPSYGLYVRWHWTCSLQSCLHFLQERLDEHAQFEIREYAKAVLSIIKNRIPNIISIMELDRNEL
jgi:thymidylate synthase (FAD)